MECAGVTVSIEKNISVGAPVSDVQTGELLMRNRKHTATAGTNVNV